MAALTFEQARECVLREVGARGRERSSDMVALLDSAGRVLAADYCADRAYPPAVRSVRDGFAVRAADLPGDLRIIGEVRAGTSFDGAVGPGEAVEIMTGAPVPAGADAVVMIEHTARDGERVRIGAPAPEGANISPRGIEALKGDVVLRRGTRVGYVEMALAASVGCAGLSVFRKPKVAIVPTGDEVVDITEDPRDWEVRNSNAYALSAQVRRAGGEPHILPVARDEYEDTRYHIERGLESHLLLISGGVSAGKYDLVRKVLEDLGAEIFFSRVRIQPGQPLAFGHVRNRFFFGLPGNPASTMVCFELFARAALEILSGIPEPELLMPYARLCSPFSQKPGLTRFLPARLHANGGCVEPVSWSGSGDIAAMARANAYLVTEPDRETWDAGDLIRVLPR